MKEIISNHDRVNILVDALPYIQKYNNKIVVVKYGGNAMMNSDLKNAVMQDIVLLTTVGVKVVVVHGGGPEIESALKRINHTSTFMNGLRYTDSTTAQVVQMVLSGKINKELVNAVKNHGGNALGISGIDGGLLDAKIKDDGKYGFVGEIKEVNSQVITDLLGKGYIPIISTVTNDKDCNILNINADIAASKIATALKAENLLLLTDVPGVLEKLDDENTLIPSLKISKVKMLIQEGVITKGMIPKIDCCVEAIRNGVGQAIIIDGRIKHSILLEMLTSSGIGTMFTK